MAKGDLRTGSASIRKVLDMMVDDLGVRNKLKENRVLNALPEVLGEGIMRKVDRAWVKDRKLFLKIHSAAMKHELSLMKDPLLARLAEVNDEMVIDDIIFR